MASPRPVDGSPAETLVWAEKGVELVAQFKSSWRRLLNPEGGSAVTASSGRPVVLEPEELEQLAEAARRISTALRPARDSSGKARPWDIEFGFTGGRLWLFQVRPFVGNDEVKNIPALLALDQLGKDSRRKISLSEVIP